MKKIKQFFKSLFSAKFIHPIVDEELDHAIHDKLRKRRQDQISETEKYNDILNTFLKTYFSKHYNNPQEMGIAFGIANKKWQKLCRDVNSTNKLINLKKESFTERVKLTINQIKQNEIH